MTKQRFLKCSKNQEKYTQTTTEICGSFLYLCAKNDYERML